MTQEDFFEWLFDKITKQKNNEDKIIRVPTDLVGTIFLQYIQDNFDEPYEEIRDESPNLIEFSPADIPDINGKKSLSDFQFKYFKENCPARAAFQVAALPKNALVEIQAVACQ